MPIRAVLSFLLLASVACGADATGVAGAIAAPKPSASASKPAAKPAPPPVKTSAVKPTGASAHKSRAVTAEDMQKVAPSQPGTTVHRVEVAPADSGEPSE